MDSLKILYDIVRTNPAMTAAFVNIGVVLLSYFGLHVTGDQLIWIITLAAGLLGVVVRSNVTPVSKLKNALALLAVHGIYPEGKPRGPVPAAVESPTYDQEGYADIPGTHERPASEETQMFPAQRREGENWYA